MICPQIHKKDQENMNIYIYIYIFYFFYPGTQGNPPGGPKQKGGLGVSGAPAAGPSHLNQRILEFLLKTNERIMNKSRNQKQAPSTDFKFFCADLRS